MVVPLVSTTSAASCCVPPAASVTVVSVASFTCRLMVAAGHVVNATGTLVTLAALAKTLAVPGVPAVARPFASTVTTLVAAAGGAGAQLIGPIVEVTSGLVLS